MSFAPLATDRLHLRRFNANDAGDLAALTIDWNVVRHTARLPHPFAPAAAAQWIAATRHDMAAGMAFNFAIERRADGCLMGSAGLALGAPDDGAELAYWLGADFWGQGYATEAAGRLVRLALESLGQRRVWAASVADNPASIRVLDKIGLRHTHDGPVPSAGGISPGVFHACAAADFRAPAEDGPPVVYVGAVALVDVADRVLLAQRPAGKQMAGLWEFPGGKVEAGETAAQACVRELSEELAVQLSADQLIPLTVASHRYPEFHLLMPLFVCRLWTGRPRAREGQALEWARPEALADYPMPPADVPLIAELRRSLSP